MAIYFESPDGYQVPAVRELVNTGLTTQGLNLDWFSFSFWIYLVSETIGSGLNGEIITFDGPQDGVTKLCPMQIWESEDASPLNWFGCWVQDSSDGSSYIYVHKDTYLPVGQWQHIVYARDASAFRMYVNGAEVSYYLQVQTGVALKKTTDPLSFGNSVTNTYAGVRGTDAYHFDDRLYNRALTLTEAKIIYEGRGTDNITNGLVGRWMMNEGTDGSAVSGASSVIDISPNGYHGTPANSPIYKAAPMKVIK